MVCNVLWMTVPGKAEVEMVIQMIKNLIGVPNRGGAITSRTLSGMFPAGALVGREEDKDK